jgi:hypothetical protein
MAKVQSYCDRERKPYPPELVQHLSATLQLRQAMGQTEMLEAQAEQLEAQAAQMSPAGQMGILPGTVAQPTPPAEGQKPGGPPVSHDPNVAAQQAQRAAAVADPQAAAAAAALRTAAKGLRDRAAGLRELYGGGKIQTPGVPVAAPPTASPPSSSPPTLSGVPMAGGGRSEVPRNRQTRPEESDEMRAGMGHTSRTRRRRNAKRTKDGAIRAITALERGPSSYHASYDTDEDRVIAAVRRRQRIAEHDPQRNLTELLENPVFWESTEKHAYREQILADLPKIMAVAGDYESMDKALRTSARMLDEALDQYEYIMGCVVDRPDSV